MSLSEQGGKVVSGAVDALRSTPVALAVLCFNVILLGSLVYMSEREGARWERVTTEIMKACQPKG